MLDQEQLDDIKQEHMHCSDCFPMKDLVETAQAWLDWQNNPGRAINEKAKLAAQLVSSGRAAEEHGDLEEAELLYSQARALWERR